MVSVTKNYLPEHLLKMTVGHSASMDTYGIYAHEFGNDLRQAAETAENAFADIINKRAAED